jgi:hypothetical protein
MEYWSIGMEYWSIGVLEIAHHSIFYPLGFLEAAVDEMEQLKDRRIRIEAENYKISNRAIICFPFHRLQDEYDLLEFRSDTSRLVRNGKS